MGDECSFAVITHFSDQMLLVNEGKIKSLYCTVHNVKYSNIYSNKFNFTIKSKILTTKTEYVASTNYRRVSESYLESRHTYIMSQDSPYFVSESINHIDNNSCNGLAQKGEIK